ncbi:sporulation inhibitor of replication protein SirA [Virgibacillus kekensis]|uniref:Sporulation inhibitor of replication protein SirA n=1 Tax=Virgibacillus kekensis TaxID=202261 RepID=A0ABV9DFW3_9BACI
MNHYSIYWIKEEFARHFFYRGDIVYRFIKDYQVNGHRGDLKSQFDYVTREFSCSDIITHIRKNNTCSKLSMEVEGDFLKIWSKRRYISLHIEKKRINFRSEIILDAEETLFPTLRSFHPHLFVMGEDSTNYGWISPVGQEDEDEIRQALYSFL